MAVVILGFIVSLLGVFTLCLMVGRKWAQTRAEINDWKAWKEAERRRTEEEQSNAAWRGNKQMVMY